MTAQQIVDRVKANIGVDWGNDDVDTFKAGDPSTIVTGVVTTSMATLEVLQKAVQARANFIITAAPTFYSRADSATPGGRGLGARRRRAPARGQGRARRGRRAGAGTRAVAGNRERARNGGVGADASSPGDAAGRSPAGTPAGRCGGSTAAPPIRSTRARTSSSRSTTWWCFG